MLSGTTLHLIIIFPLFAISFVPMAHAITWFEGFFSF